MGSCTPTRLTYERLGILVSDFPAYKEGGTTSGNLVRVQSMDYSFSHPAVDVKSIGSDSFMTKGGESPIIRNADVSCNIQYLFSSGENEKLLGLHVGADGSIFKSRFDSPSTDDINVIVVASNKEDHQDLSNQTDYSGYNVIGIGNCFLDAYNYSASVGSLPTASVSFKGSNMTFHSYEPDSVPTLPSIKLGMDNVLSEEKLNLDEDSFGYDIVPGANVIMPGDIQINIEKLAGAYGGIPIEAVDAAIQNISINVPIGRQDIYGFGSNYVFDRKLKFPIMADVSMDVILREYDTGSINSFFKEGAKYNMTIDHTNRYFHSGLKQDVVNQFVIENAQLREQSYQKSIGQEVAVSTSFVVGISVSGGFKILD